MSASSFWVTWGIVTQLRARCGAEIRWIRERWTRSTGPNFSKSILRSGARSRPKSEPAGEAGEPASFWRSRKLLDVLARDPALAPAAVDLMEVDAALAGKAPDRGARVHGPV